MPPRHARARVVAALPLLFVACGGDEGSKPSRLAWSTDPASIANPWPSDRLLANGNAGTPPGYFTRVLPAEPAYDAARAFLEDAVAALGAAAGGYSVYAPLVLPASRRVDPARVTGIHLFPESGGDEVPLAVAWSDPLSALTAAPVVPLRGAMRYVVIVSDRRLAASADLAAARDSDASLAPLFVLAAARGLADDPADVDLAFAFTTQRVEEELFAAGARIDSPLGDDLLPAYVDSAGLPFAAGVHTAGDPAFDAVFEAAGARRDSIGTVAQGVFSAFEWRDAEGTLDTSLVSGTGTPGRVTVDFRLAVPEGTPPRGGWPVVIASHGVSGSSVEPLQRAWSFALAGAATIGATATDHGWRGTILDFFDFTRPLHVRDGFRQSALEILQLERAIRNGHDAGVPPFDTLDPGRISYFGNSFGGILGGAVAAASSRVDAVGFSVSGGRLPRLFDGETGTLLLALFGAAVGLPGDDPRFDDFVESFRVVAQWAVDPADPGALAPAVPPSRPVLIQMALGDRVFLNEASEDLRLALGLPVLDTPADPFTGRGGLWVWDKDAFPGEVPEDTTAHDLYWDFARMRHQMEDFLLSEGTVLSAE